MKLKRILAGVAAASVAVSSIAISAFAADPTAVTFKDETGKATLGDSSKGDNTRIAYNVVDILPEGVDINDVYGVTLNIDTTNVDLSGGMGGSYIFSTKGNNWNGLDWSNDTIDLENGKMTRLEEEPFFTATDISGAEGEYAQVVVDAYWGSGEVVVKSIDFLGQDGTVLGAEPAKVGNTNFDDGDPTEVIKPTLPGVLTYDPTQNNGAGGWRININHCWAPDREDFQILGDNVGKLTGAVAIGVHFDVSEFEDYGKPFDVDINLSADNKQSYWGDPATAAGVTTKPVTVDKDGDYIAWVMLDQPIEDATSNLFFMLDVQIDAPAPAEVEAGDGLPAIEVTEIGIQDGTPADPSEPEPSEPTPADPSEPEPSEPEPSEPQTPGECPGDPNGSGDDNGNTSVDNGDDNNPGTGVALAVVPAVLAAGALATATIVLKKRK